SPALVTPSNMASGPPQCNGAVRNGLARRCRHVRVVRAEVEQLPAETSQVAERGGRPARPVFGGFADEGAAACFDRFLHAAGDERALRAPPAERWVGRRKAEPADVV